jgi:hypothetical protein
MEVSSSHLTIQARTHSLGPGGDSMPRPRSIFPAPLLLLVISACGANRQLQSISISPSIGTGPDVAYTATGTFNRAPITVTPVSVSWYVLPDVDPPPAMYSLSGGTFIAARCPLNNLQFTATVTVVALAPANPDAPRSGAVPSQVMQDLVYNRTRTVEGGFVAAAAKLTCQ